MEKPVEHVLHLVSTSDVVPEHLSVYFAASNRFDLLYVPWSQHGHLPSTVTNAHSVVEDDHLPKLPLGDQDDHLVHIVQPPLVGRGHHLCC